MKQCSPLCSKILGVIRIVVGLWMLYMGLMKLGADAQMIEMVGGAGPALGLSFLSAANRFWIAVVGEILAGLFLISGCCKLTKIGAWLTVIIMIFALNYLGWTTPETIMAWGFLLAAVIILLWGRGARCFCPGACCKMGATCETTGGCCGGVCHEPTMKEGMNQIKTGAATMGAGAVASATEMAEKVKDIATDAKEAASDMAEKAVATAEAVLDKADDMIDDAKEVVEKASDKVDDMKDA